MKHPFLNPEFSYQRLLKEYKQYGSIAVAVDFDNTVYDYHQIGMDCSELMDLLRKLKSIDCYITLWTCSDDYGFIKKYCAENQIPYNAINKDPPFFSSGSRKIFYSELLDDRAGLRESFDRLTKLYEQIVSERKK
jgi:hypothetical protein